MNVSTWIASSRPRPQAHLRLFCFPYAGGGASLFHTWSDELPSQIEVCPVQLPGRENRLTEPPFTCLSALIQVLARILCPYLDKPFAFFGHSMGALISFELSHYLYKHYGLEVAHLLISGRYAPQLQIRKPPDQVNLYQLSADEFIEELRHINGTRETVFQDMELMHLLLPVLRADFELCETYVYSQGDQLSCPISAFGGIQDKDISYDDLVAWQDQTCSTFRVQMLPGDHFFLHTSRALLLQAVARDLLQTLLLI